MDSWLLKSEKDLTAGGVQEQLAAGRVWAATTGPDVQGAAGNMDEKVLAAGGVGGLAAGRGKTCGRWRKITGDTQRRVLFSPLQNRAWIVFSKQQQRPSVFAVAGTILSSGSVAGTGGASYLSSSMLCNRVQKKKPCGFLLPLQFRNKRATAQLFSGEYKQKQRCLCFCVSVAGTSLRSPAHLDQQPDGEPFCISFTKRTAVIILVVVADGDSGGAGTVEQRRAGKRER
ncbi:hypothetical protein MRB53_002097 [Persea americana]|uniref:Uncharacterized protein n=1 Tax=Persea americana TaxID=3435 RepID=A0ACC2MTN3_PERAE|nr:hypothetical protein MRB53_002097 [Persea americana]